MNLPEAIRWRGFRIMIPTNKDSKRVLSGPVPAWITLSMISAACWIFYLTGGGTGMAIHGMSTYQIPFTIRVEPGEELWSASYAVMMVAMWWSMMIAMMLPGAFGHFPSYARPHANTSAKLLFFGLGYVIVWLGYSVFATAVQFTTQTLGLLHAMKMWSVSKDFSLALLVAAGIYQFAHHKRDSLLRCNERKTVKTPFLAGVRYGFNCLQASWALMLLLFVGGVMNIFWVVSLSVVVAIEKKMINTRAPSILIGVTILAIAALSAVR
jgi:predicted metal-binding membrane protein